MTDPTFHEALDEYANVLDTNEYGVRREETRARVEAMYNHVMQERDSVLESRAAALESLQPFIEENTSLRAILDALVPLLREAVQDWDDTVAFFGAKLDDDAKLDPPEIAQARAILNRTMP